VTVGANVHANDLVPLTGVTVVELLSDSPDPVTLNPTVVNHASVPLEWFGDRKFTVCGSIQTYGPRPRCRVLICSISSWEEYDNISYAICHERCSKNDRSAAKPASSVCIDTCASGDRS
jgi:hypothetical protein